MKQKGSIIRLIIGCLLIGAIGITVWQSQSIDVVAISQTFRDLDTWAWLFFILLYAIGTVFFFPGSLLTLAGGAIFGPVLGTFYNLTAATLGAAVAFLVARYLAADWIEMKTAGRLKQIKNGVEDEGWRFVAFVRLVPLFPFNLLNYALGLTRIRFTHYILATYFCMLPGAIAFSYLGYAGKEAITGNEDLIQKVMLAIALLAIAAFLPRMWVKFKQKK